MRPNTTVIAPFMLVLTVFGILPPMRVFLSLLLITVAGLAWALAPASPAVAAQALPTGEEATVGLPKRDHERVREAVARGEMVPLSVILADAQRRHPGTVLDVELDEDEYEIEILGANGVIMELEYDARTGALLDAEVDD